MDEEIVEDYIKLEYKSNYTTMLLLPTISVGNLGSIRMNKNLTILDDPYSIFREFGFLSIYCFRKEEQYESDVLYGLFNPPEYLYERFGLLTDYLEQVNIKNYQPLINWEEVKKGIFIVKFRIHKRYEGIKDVFLTSKYSKINLLYPNYVDFFDGNSLAYRVLIKSVKRKKELEDITGETINEKWEYLDKIDENKETLWM